MNLKELSKALGLSPTTVSRALNGYPEVADGTRRRVLEAAQRHNYRPNARARSLATGRARAIGHVIPVSARHEMVNPVFSDFIAGASEAYARRSYDMMLSLVPDGSEIRVYHDLATRGAVDGLIIQAPRVDDPRVKLLRAIRLPFVVHGRFSGDEGGYDWVDVDSTRAFQRATGFLLDLGHRRIALINGLRERDFAARRLEGFAQALQARGLAADPDLVRSGEMTEAYGYRSAQEMLALAVPPTAFLCASMIPALGVRRAAEARGLRLGRDLSLVTHDDELSYLSNGCEEPMFTATRSSVREAGRLCAERVMELVETPSLPPRHSLLEAELTVGQSTGPAPHR